MVITTTAVAFILLALGLAFLGWRFLRAFYKIHNPETRSQTGLLLGFCFVATALQNAILGFGALFFAQSPVSLFGVSITAHLFLTFFAALTIYTAYYIFLPNTSPLFAIFVTCTIGLLGLISAVNSGQLPFITPQNGVDWNMNFPFALTTFFLLLVGLGIFFYIFLQLFRKAETPETRILSFTIVVTTLIGIANTFVRLVLLQRSPVSFRTTALDIGIGTLGVIFIVGFIIAPLVHRLFKRQKSL